MNVDILINQLDEHNEGSILAAKEFRPKKVYYIREKEDSDEIKKLKDYYNKNLNGMELKEAVINEGDYKALEGLINSEKEKQIYINLTGGKRINSLMLLDICVKNKITAFYADIKNKCVFEFRDGIKLIEKEFEDLEIEDIVKASGGMIVEEESKLSTKKDLLFFAEQISKNLSLWHKYKQQLYEASIFEHDKEESNRIYIHMNNLDDEEKDLLEKILGKLKEMNEIRFRNNNGIITVEFINDYLKSFIFKSGTWLEVLTHSIINKIEEIDDSKNGVMFLWNDENQTLRNELDVVAIKDSIPIFISCKDSNKYNEMALNELNVYAEKLGGENAYKILVATKEPIKAPVKIRAKEMGIHLVIFDGNEEKFIKQIKDIINK